MICQQEMPCGNQGEIGHAHAYLQPVLLAPQS